MFLRGRFYMHKKAADVCALITDDCGNSIYEVQWYVLGKVGTPTPLNENVEQIFMHSDVWHDITENIKEPREKWS